MKIKKKKDLMKIKITRKQKLCFAFLKENNPKTIKKCQVFKLDFNFTVGYFKVDITKK